MRCCEKNLSRVTVFNGFKCRRREAIGFIIVDNAILIDNIYFISKTWILERLQTPETSSTF
ncbi:hypothetical protein AGRO_4768 [Agrobacterium sp. ATCC 31749]|nr:hypothetical protein AGRO_4768 [Agrobacterium sp. ATCC 31749]